MDNQGHFDFDKDSPNPLSHGTEIAKGRTSWNKGNTSFLQQYLPLYNALSSGNLDAAEEYLKHHLEAVSAKITSNHETALHVATMFGHLHIVERLVQLMSEEDLALQNNDGTTALHLVALIENKDIIEVAKCMVEKNNSLVAIRDASDWLPVTLALDLGHTEMARYLYSVTPFEVLLPENGKHGVVLLVQCYYTKMFDIALDLLKRCPRLAVAEGRRKLNFLEMLANMPSELLRESQLPFWKRWLHPWVHLQKEPSFAIKDIKDVFVNIPEAAETRDDFVRSTSFGLGLLHQSVRSTLHLLGIKKYEARSAHKQSLLLLRAAFSVIYTLNEEEIKASRIRSAVLMAAKRGNPEFIVEAIKVHYPFLWSTTDDGRSLFFLAVQFRQAEVLNLIHGLVMKHVFANTRDKHANCLLHMAGLLAPPIHLSRISGALLQMQRELQWFKEVESIIPHMKKEYLNMDNKTPRDLFTENHKDLVKQGEKWTKGNASSCSVVAALVATITFAAAFTVPGGTDQIKGYPIFVHEKLFMLFMISDAASLFSSTTSLLMFLGLLTSRYAEDDFLKSLPTRMIIGLSTMFISLATMMTAFCAALFLMLECQSWIVIPVTVLACAPITLYIWLQFPLLVEIFVSTYGLGIFDRNVKPWP